MKQENKKISKTLVMVFESNDEVVCYALKDKDQRGWAKYWFIRNIEKYSRIATRAFIIDSSNELPLKLWKSEYDKKIEKFDKEQREIEEKIEYDRLKSKYGTKR